MLTVGDIMRNDYGYRNLILDMGLKISYYRKKRGLSQEDLAERVGVSTSYIGMIEAPNICKSASLKTIYAIASELDIPIAKLFEE
ncbi:helix-turn-helix transcriptional regulator [Butyricicoccus faecihominis]|uniref:helix-turn-helix domain-containing protein n=1 Tax=Butyricicoccus faecihominis TaxID=1712515 RepID=UPI002478E414|nr:helix-turn-helix transcriptional regulator [Butyricicoccus faecihominis]MCQ5129969.1 helix-turn-helix transcriptional regulator [Butyricicoccus faecihominis]